MLAVVKTSFSAPKICHDSTWDKSNSRDSVLINNGLHYASTGMEQAQQKLKNSKPCGREQSFWDVTSSLYKILKRVSKVVQFHSGEVIFQK